MQQFRSLTGLVGRLALCTIFFMSAVGHKIPAFGEVVEEMQREGVPQARIMLMGAIAFLIAGSISVVLGIKARFGATLLLIFLVLATYYFHDFWNQEGEAVQLEMIQFMKNLALMGAMLIVISNGAGNGSLDQIVGYLEAEDRTASEAA